LFLNAIDSILLGGTIMKFQDKLKELRTKHNETQQDLADYLNITFQSVSKWEKGICLPNIELIKEIASHYNVSLDSLLIDQLKIEETKIEILDEECLGSVEDEVVTIARKIFLLSVIELGFEPNYMVGKEGKPLDYFDDYKNRLAYLDNSEKAVSWWLRSADSGYYSCVFAIGPECELGSGNAFALNGVRPAFCVDGDLSVEEKDGKYVIVAPDK
jgi:transcriptional regulator with XRE-family HTH domain